LFYGHGILLVSGMSQNPRTPFDSIYRSLALPLTKFIIKHAGGNEEAVEEVFSETIAAAWKGWNTFKHKSSYFTWLCRIALNKIADYYRDQVNHNSGIIVPILGNLNIKDDKTLSPEEKIALDELKISVNSCLNLLPWETRKLLKLRYWEELSYREIARILDISERAVEGKLYRAKHTFAKVWPKVTRNRGL
jgi:RNA polymerase sigma factor (sigma-70 family)